MQVIVVQRFLPDSTRKCRGEFSAWICPAEYRIGNGVSGFAACIPDIEDGRYVITFPVED